MKFIFLGYDFMLPVAQRLIDDGHTLIGIMSFECDQVFNFSTNCQTLAQNLGIPFIQSPVTDIHIDSFLGQDAKLFIAAGYPFKIPPIDETKAYGINIHPSCLPRARGLMPVPHILMARDHNAAGFTIHKLSPKFDQGDILAQHKINLLPGETVETYSAKILHTAPDLLSKTIENIEKSWVNAKPQNKKNAYTAPLPTDAMRTINWNDPIGKIQRMADAFGRFGCLAQIENRLLSVYELHSWKEKHAHAPGACLVAQQKLITIAAKDGFICLTDFSEARL